MEQPNIEKQAQVMLRKKASRFDSVFLLANQRADEMSQEIKKIELSFGSNEHLLKRLTLLDYDTG